MFGLYKFGLGLGLGLGLKHLASFNISGNIVFIGVYGKLECCSYPMVKQMLKIHLLVSYGVIISKVVTPSERNEINLSLLSHAPESETERNAPTTYTFSAVR